MAERALLEEHMRRGVELLGRRRWYDAHEAFEAAWKLAEGRERSRLQGLVQLVVALEHLRRGNLRGARSVFRRAIARLEGDDRDASLRAWVREVVSLFGPAMLSDEPQSPPPPEQWPIPRRG